MDFSQSQIVSFIRSFADECLCDVFACGQYRDVILPMVVLRRFDALLEATKDEVEAEVKKQREVRGLDDNNLDEDALYNITGFTFYNTSKWTLKSLKAQPTNNETLYSNFVEYLNGYSENVKDVLRNFGYYNKAKRLADNNRLLSVIEKITDPHINLTNCPATDPDGLPLPPLSNIAMGTIFEELSRRFSAENNRETGEHFTPRDIIVLLARLAFEPVKGNIPELITFYDPAAGTGGILSEARNYLLQLGVKENAMQLYGTEINPETYAICKADLIVKGVDSQGVHLGNTITENYFRGKSFGYCIANPPYGKSWKTDKEKIYHDGALTDPRYELPLRNFRGEVETVDCTPRTSDGQLLFILEEIDKMKSLEDQPQGSRIVSIHNGASLFTGDAGQGESNIRRYLIENDLVDCILQLPNSLFYNTSIATYVWVLTNKKLDARRGFVQLIDASRAYEKLRKNQGDRSRTITPERTEQIVQCYMAFADQRATDDCPVESKVLRGDVFRYYAVTVERPLRLRCQCSAIKADALLFDTKDEKLSRWLYQTYGERVFDDIATELPTIKADLQEQGVKKTSQQLLALIAPTKWQERRTLMQAAQKIVGAVGTEVFMDYNIFADKITTVAKALGLKLSAAQIKAICRAMSVADPEAEPVIKKVLKSNAKEIAELTDGYGITDERLADCGIYRCGNQYMQYEPDSALRDSEKIPVGEDICGYFQREVHPYVADAWIELPQTKIGCEISFDKYFSRPAPLRTLAENDADIRALDAESKGLIEAILNAK